MSGIIAAITAFMLSLFNIFAPPSAPVELVQNFPTQFERDSVMVKGLASLPKAYENRIPERNENWAPPSADIITAESYIVMDSHTGQVLYSRDPNKVWPAASITKLMTAIVSYDIFEKNGVSLEDTIAVIAEDDSNGTRYIYADETVKLADVFTGMLVGSINSFAKILMRSTGEGEQGFLNKMNEKARRFGLWNTTFADVTGLSENNTITAKEGAWLLKEALDYPIIQDALLQSSYLFETENTQRTINVINTNKLLESEYRIEGGKTGHIVAAKYNFAVRVGNNIGDAVMIVVLGSDTEETRFTDTSELAEWTFDNYDWTSL